MNVIVIGEMGTGKASLLHRLEHKNFPKVPQETKGQATVKYGKNNKKSQDLTFFKAQPEIAHHGSGWEDEELALQFKNKDIPIHAAVLCIPAKTYAARHASICSKKSIKSWILFLSRMQNGPIVICRTKLDLESGESKEENDLLFPSSAAKELIQAHEQVVGYYDVSAKDGTGCDEWYDTVGGLIVNNTSSGCTIM